MKICLCDTGSGISCINSSVKGICCNQIIESNRNPVGANGLQLENNGDILGQIEIGDQKYDGRFTLITDLCFDIVLGTDILEGLGIYVNPDGTKLEIAGQEICRVFEGGYVNCIPTSIPGSSVNAKVLCITHIGQCNGKSAEGTNKGTAHLVSDQHTKTANMPTHTYPADSQTNTIDATQHKGLNQHKTPMSTSGHKSPTMRIVVENSAKEGLLQC